jgi:hypothetical protein
MTIWSILGFVFAAGAVGGVVNALLTDNGFILPSSEPTDSTTILRPGILGNVLVGAIAATVSWGLYGPFANAVVAPSSQTPMSTLTLAALVGAILVGISGARWLTNEVDKKLLKATASAAAASAKAEPEAAVKIMTSSPAQALRQALELNR